MLAESGSGTYNVASGIETSTETILTLLARRAGLEGKLHVEPTGQVLPGVARHAGCVRRLASLGSGFDRIVLHFHPDVIYRLPPTPGGRIDTGLSYGAAFRRLRATVELRLHEIDRTWADSRDPSSHATRFLLTGADRITVHSEEQRDILSIYGSREKDHYQHIEIVEALEAHDVDLSVERMKSHLEGVRNVLLRWDPEAHPAL